MILHMGSQFDYQLEVVEGTADMVRTRLNDLRPRMVHIDPGVPWMMVTGAGAGWMYAVVMLVPENAESVELKAAR